MGLRSGLFGFLASSSPHPSPPPEEEREKTSARKAAAEDSTIRKMHRKADAMLLRQSLAKTQKSSLQTATVFLKTLYLKLTGYNTPLINLTAVVD
jgi:hypothetical protein